MEDEDDSSDEMEIVNGYDPELDDGEDVTLEIHHYIIDVVDGESIRTIGITNIDDVMQRVRSEAGRKGYVRIPVGGAIPIAGVAMPIHYVRADLVASVTEVFVVMCASDGTDCEGELDPPFTLDADGDPICEACLAEEDEDDGEDLLTPPPHGGGGITLVEVSKVKESQPLPVGFSPS